MPEHRQKKLKKNQTKFQMDQLYGENILNFHFYQINKSKISDYIFIVIQKRKNLEKIKELLYINSHNFWCNHDFDVFFFQEARKRLYWTCKYINNILIVWAVHRKMVPFSDTKTFGRMLSQDESQISITSNTSHGAVQTIR